MQTEYVFDMRMCDLTKQKCWSRKKTRDKRAAPSRDRNADTAKGLPFLNRKSRENAV